MKGDTDLNFQGNILIYQNEKGDTKVDAYFNDSTIWMTQKSISQLYQTSPQNVTLHIKNIYADGELYEEATCKDYLQVQSEGSRTVQRKVKIYNLDMILAIGYRVRNNIGIHFRNWSSSVLSEYMKKGFVLNDDMLKNGKLFGKDYFAVTGKTAAELVYERVNAEKPAMGLTTWKDAPDGKILKRDISVAKNYLNEKELSRLNRLVTMFIDYAELMAEDEVLMSMQDWVEQTNQFLRNNRREVLEGKGKVSHDMVQKRQF